MLFTFWMPKGRVQPTMEVAASGPWVSGSPPLPFWGVLGLWAANMWTQISSSYKTCMKPTTTYIKTAELWSYRTKPMRYDTRTAKLWYCPMQSSQLMQEQLSCDAVKRSQQNWIWTHFNCNTIKRSQHILIHTQLNILMLCETDTFIKIQLKCETIKQN